MSLLPAEYRMCLVSWYPVGGQTTLAEHVDPDTEEWIPLATLKERTTESRTVAMLGCVYHTGGCSCSEGTHLQSMEKYDPHMETWGIVDTCT